MKGIDISMHNGTINFNKVKNSGIDIVIIKATEGIQYVDPLLNQHHNGAKAQNMNIGFYHFMSEKTNPGQQAVDFWNSIKNKQFNVKPCLDIEVNSYSRNKTEISNRCIEFLEKFKSLSGLNCMIYTGGYFGRDNLDGRVKQYPGWIAHYGVNHPMQTGFNVVGHQYTDRGRVGGTNGNVDMNNFTEGVFMGAKPAQRAKQTWEYYISGDIVRRLQAELNRQFGAGLVVDGYCGDRTLSKLVTVRINARGEITKIIQELLIRKGYSVGRYGADGVFGNSTYNAVVNFQRGAGLNVDGIVGINTWRALLGI